MKTIAIANHKGGVGKTATAHALGEALSLEKGRRVLLVDNDSQASLTGACGVTEVWEGWPEVLAGDVKLAEILVDVGLYLKLAPADLALAPLEMSLGGHPRRGSIIKEALDSVKDDFDIALIDCSPNLGLLTINALAAADGVIVPSQPQAVDMQGLEVFLDAVAQVREGLNPSLELIGILLTFFDTRFNHHQDIIGTMIEKSLPVLETKIGRSVRVAEAAGKGKSIIAAYPMHPQAENYRELAEILDSWMAR